MKPYRFLAGGLFLALLAGCFLKPRSELLPAPVLLPGTRPEMNTAGYWIARHPCPDSLILAPDQIEEFINRPVREELKAVRDLTEYPETRRGQTVREDLEGDLAPFLTGKHYDLGGELLKPEFFRALRDELNLDALPATLPVRFALATDGVNLRELPTEEGSFAQRDEHDFDELQNSGFDIGTPFAAVWISRSGRWTYVITPYNKGWIPSSSVAYCDKPDIAGFTNPKRFIITLRSKCDLFLDPQRTDFAGTVQMGARLPLLELTDSLVKTRIPRREADGRCRLTDAWMNRDGVREGYLDYTPRHALEQAFEMLNAPYGWSGMYGEQDCSRFLQQIFACFGMQIPRKSTLQGQTGDNLGSFPAGTTTRVKAEILKNKAIGGITVLQMPGHVVLYLGRNGDELYAIHATWAFRQRENGVERVRVINRVVVSTLDLGGDSRRGSLLFRTRNIRLLGK
jgi:hypothetical protein